tara:strand:+ start:1283 stop:1846 length:564 start_codon:yes stop_codon:yes gene_type:complete
MTELLLNSLNTFYNKDDNYAQLCSLINPKSHISLRLIDWFVTNYAKKHNTIYLLNRDTKEIVNDTSSGGAIVQINVFQEYKSQLKAFSKKRFDPFCRRERIMYVCNDTPINTTLGQLNFFRWVLSTHFIEFVRKNKDIIESDMNFSLKNTQETGIKNKNGRKSRQELSKSALRGLNKNKLSICITFD